MRIICILGKSGSGKSTIEKKLESIGYNRIISYTTRKPRSGEVNGREYHFVTEEGFKQLIKKDILMEHAIYSGNYYGAPRPVGSINNVIVVETDGFKKIKEIYGDQVTGVYIDVSDELANQRRGIRSDTSNIESNRRKNDDTEKFNNIENIVDLVVDGSKAPDDIVIDILRKVKGSSE